MAALLKITCAAPQDEIDTYGTGARIYIQKGLTDLVVDSAALTSLLIVAGTTAYEYGDIAGTPGTDRYFVRYGRSTISVADDASGWTGPLLAGSPSGEVIALETVKTWTGITDTVDDSWLAIAVGSLNRSIMRGIGVDIGSSPDTSRTYDGRSAVRGRTRLWVPGGIRTFTAVEITYDAGTTWTAVTADVRVGPHVHEREPGVPGAFIEFKAVTTVASSFPDETDDVRITGTAFACFGWEAYPMDLVQDASSALQRMVTDRAGASQWPNETTAMRYLSRDLLTSYRVRHFPGVA